MNKEIEKYIKNISLDYLSKNKVGSCLEKAFSIYDRLQQNIIALADQEEGVVALKVMTVMTFAVLEKLREGRKLSDLSKQDWEEIANSVSKYAILQDESKYVLSIFGMYEKYIRASADYIEVYATEKQVAEVRLLADEIAEKTNLFRKNQIQEIEYIEQCLWISLEAMIKLLASTMSKFMCEEYAEFIYALAMYTFEYGRMALYKQEQELIAEYIEMQYQLDCDLQNKYEKFMEELYAQSEQFMTLIDNAFVPDFRESFLGSIALAKSLGISENEILTTIEDIDSFFED